MLKFLYNEPVAVFGSWLIISDLHIGKKAGVNWKTSARIVHELMERERKEKLLVLGDVKATIASTEGDAGKFIREIGSAYDLHITKGNHDGNIEKYHNYCAVYGPEGGIFDGLAALHGHAWPGKELLKCRMMIIGHAHPVYTFGVLKRMGQTTQGKGKLPFHSEKVWIIGKLDVKALREHYGKETKISKEIKLVCMPAFGPVAGASGVKEGLGPLMKNTFIKRSAEIYLLNGIQLK